MSRPRLILRGLSVLRSRIQIQPIRHPGRFLSTVAHNFQEKPEPIFKKGEENEFKEQSQEQGQEQSQSSENPNPEPEPGSKKSRYGIILSKWLYGLLFFAGVSYIAVTRKGDESIIDTIAAVPAEAKNLVEEIKEPRSKKLLPDVLPAQYQKPYTLVINLEKFLICYIYDEARGEWRVAKRPGADLFLYNLAAYYEIVLFTSMQAAEAHMIMEKIDPLFYLVMYRLFRDSTRYDNGVYYKVGIADIGLLNRDLSKVIYLDHETSSIALHPENSIQVLPWDGNPDDSLENYIDFLEGIPHSQVKDVRAVIKEHSGKDIQNIFEEKQMKSFAEYQKLQQRSLDTINVTGGLRKWLGFGQKPQPTITKVPTYEEFKELKHQQRLKVYNHYKSLMDKDLAEAKKMEEEYYKNNPVTVTSVFNNIFNPQPVSLEEGKKQ